MYNSHSEFTDRLLNLPEFPTSDYQCTMYNSHSNVQFTLGCTIHIRMYNSHSEFTDRLLNLPEFPTSDYQCTMYNSHSNVQFTFGCTIHIRNLQKLMLEVYKCLKSENPSFKWNIFQTKDVAYNLRTKNLQLPSTNTLSYGNDSLSFRGAILWNTLSDSIKSLATSASFKRSIKEWKGDNCSYKICR